MNKFIYLLTILAILFHPVVDIGSDEDDAIEIGWQQLLNLESPYKVKTQLNNPITPTLGGFLLSAPGMICAEILGLFAVIMLQNGGILWIIAVILSLKTLAQGIDYLYCSAVLCLVLRYLTDHASFHSGRSSFEWSDGGGD